MERLKWILVGFAGAGMILALLIYLVTLPDGTKSLTARANGATSVDLSYRPGKPEVRIAVRFEGLGQHEQAQVRVTSSESWAPSWDITIEGEMSEFLTLGDGYSTAPEPMTKALAERIARSYKVTTIEGGEERTIDFATAQVKESLVLPTLDVLRYSLLRSAASD